MEPKNKAELLSRTEQSWRKLDELVGGLGDSQLSAPGADGWSVKDHLAHIAAWQLSVIALLDGRDREAALGMAGLPDHNEDDVNEALVQRHRSLPPDEVRALQSGSRQMMLDRLAPLTDADLSRPYSYFQPQESGPNSGAPVSGWIEGNLYEHVEEHLAYIRQLAGSAAT